MVNTTLPKTFDDIQVARPELANSYLQLMQAQPGRPLALFARRRVGKTHFLANDLMPAATAAGMLPVYADVWLHRKAPMLAINHALEEALDDKLVPASRGGKTAKTSVKGVGVLGTSVQFGDEPARRPLPDDPALRLDALIPRLAAATGRPILLMLDEIQALGESDTGGDAIAALRAVFQKHRSILYGIFTGSSQHALTTMIVAAGAPMYQFAQLLDFPYLDATYLDMLADHFEAVHPGKMLDRQAMARTFEHVGFKPALMKDIVKCMSAEGMVDFAFGLDAFIHDDTKTIGWATLWTSLDEIQRMLLVALVYRFAPFSQDAIDRLNALRVVKSKATISKFRTALEKLRLAGVVAPSSRGGYEVEDALFAEFIKGMPDFLPMSLPAPEKKPEAP